MNLVIEPYVPKYNTLTLLHLLISLSLNITNHCIQSNFDRAMGMYQLAKMPKGSHRDEFQSNYLVLKYDKRGLFF